MSNTQEAIAVECDAVKELLLAKNREYGDSALNPVRIFSKVDAVEQLKVRIDDKLSRIGRGKGQTIKEDTVQDLIGYLVLLRVAQQAERPEMPTGGRKEITVNGKTVVSFNESLSHERIVDLAFELVDLAFDAPTRPGEATVTYDHGKGDSRGSIRRGESIGIVDGMAFNVEAA